MINIKIIVNDDKTILLENEKLIDKFDNLISSLNFDFTNFDFNKFDKLNYKYFAIKRLEDYELINITDNEPIILISEFTKLSGEFECLIVLSEREQEKYTQLNDYDNFVSNSFFLLVNNNFLISTDNLDIRTEKEAL